MGALNMNATIGTVEFEIVRHKKANADFVSQRRTAGAKFLRFALYLKFNLQKSVP